MRGKGSRILYTAILILIAAALLLATAYAFVRMKYTVIGSETERSIDNLQPRDVETLDLSGCDMDDLNGIERCSDLRELDISGSRIGDLAAVGELVGLERLNAGEGAINEQQYEQLAERLPDCDILWDVPLAGTTVRSDTESITLTGQSADDCQGLRYLHSLKNAELVDCVIDDAMLSLCRELPECVFHWTVEYAGETLDSATDFLDLNSRKTDLEELSAALAKLPHMKRVELCDSGLSNEQMETLIQRFPEVKFVWRIYMGPWDLRTDATNFSTAHINPMRGYIKNEPAQQLKYCTDLVALDLGHNKVSDISFVTSLKKLRSLILVDCGVTDLTPLASLENLEYLELFENGLQDLSPLASVTTLKELNVSKNKITDPSPLFGLPNLERLWIGINFISDDDVEKLKASLPEGCELRCRELQRKDHPCNYGWRPLDYRLWGFRYEHPLNVDMNKKMEGQAREAAMDQYETTGANIDPDACGDE